MGIFKLVAHPDFASAAVTAITVSATRQGASLSLAYTLQGDLDAVRWPEPADHVRTDDLWRHTCMEAFIQPRTGSGYTELNVSPSGRWASYVFDAHRVGMRHAPVAPSLSWRRPTLTASALLPHDAKEHWRIGLTAVIEALDGTKSFWALAHAPGPPDFHNQDCFVATLAAPRPA